MERSAPYYVWKKYDRMVAVMNKDNIGHKLNDLIDTLMDDYNGGRTIDEIKSFEQPNRDVVIDILEKLRKIVYPGYYKNNSFKFYTSS